MVITHNVLAMNAERQLNIVNDAKAKSQEKLSSGYRINRAADDAAGLSISEKMRFQIRGLNRGAQNIEDGVSLVQVADGALAEVHDMLQRMNELSIQAANGTLAESDRQDIQKEVDQITEEIDRIGKTTSFNDRYIFDGPMSHIDRTYTYTVETETETTGKLVSSGSEGYSNLAEAYLLPNGKYSPAATLDFSNVTAKNINALNGKSFSFGCTDNCDETFKFTFKTDGTTSGVTDRFGKVEHKYTIDISKCTSGEEILKTLYDYVYDNMPGEKDKVPYSTPTKYEDLKVSHSNLIHISGNVLTLYSNIVSRYRSTAEEAAQVFLKDAKAKERGKISLSEVTGIVTKTSKTTVEEFTGHEEYWKAGKQYYHIQCSSEVPDQESLYTTTMNSKVLGLYKMDCTTADGATDSIDVVDKAIAMISENRSALGALQNRLEHAYNSNRNTAENTQAAESTLRDTDYAREMVRYSTASILAQAGSSMLTQANQLTAGVMNLLEL